MSLEEATKKYKLNKYQDNRVLKTNKDGCETLSVGFDRSVVDIISDKDSAYLAKAVRGINIIFSTDTVTLSQIVSSLEKKFGGKAIFKKVRGMETYEFHPQKKVLIAVQQRGIGYDIGESNCYSGLKADKIFIFFCYNLEESEFENYVFTKGKSTIRD
jgi:hypothetical protein